METTRDSAATLIDNCRDEWLRSPWIMSEEEMLNNRGDFHTIKIEYRTSNEEQLHWSSYLMLDVRLLVF